jgi:branched-chain amino acid transport system substrate-binding protein
VSRKKVLLAGAAAIVVMAGACSSSSKSSSTGGSTGGSGGSKTLTVGILTDYTGPGSSGNKTSVQGVEAGAALAKQQGWTIKYVLGDTATSPATAQSAAQKMVEVDHVDAVIAVSAVAFGGATYLHSQNVPVVGTAEDATEWITSNNMFSVYGVSDFTKVSNVTGKFLNLVGATNLGAIGYSISPSSSEAAKAAAASAQHAGLKVGYLNASFPFGSTNVQPEALAMKSAGVDAFTATVDPNTGLALISAMRDLGVSLKAAFLPTGYGGDLLQAGPGAIANAQNVYFYTSWEPVEMNTAATRQFQGALKDIGITTDPTYAEYAGYTSVGLLLEALKTTGPHPSHQALINAIAGIKSWDNWGLTDGHTFDMGDKAAQISKGGGTGCEYFAKLSGQTFQVVSGADPICGEIIPGVTVSASS